jgi:hypothetical protein
VNERNLEVDTDGVLEKVCKLIVGMLMSALQILDGECLV